MHKPLWLLCLMFVCVPGLRASPVLIDTQNETHCIFGAQEQISPGSCSVGQLGAGSVFAQASANGTYKIDQRGTLTATVDAGASAGYFGPNPPTVSPLLHYALARVDMTINLTTDGPVRAGLAQIEAHQYGVSFSNASGVSVLSFSRRCQDTSGSGCHNFVQIPVTLGTPLVLNLYATAAPRDGGAYVDFSLQVNELITNPFSDFTYYQQVPLRLYDPAATEAPEPGTFVLAGIAGLVLACRKMARRRLFIGKV
jgi:hypothetical protein